MSVNMNVFKTRRGVSLQRSCHGRNSSIASIVIAPVGLAGYREVVTRDAEDRVERHFVILSFAARWVAGEPVLNEELTEARWLKPAELADLSTTEGLAEIVAAAFARLAATG